jgi:hypothetical protein
MPIVSHWGTVLETLALLRRLKQAEQRVVARIEFALQGKKRLTPLSVEQLRQFQHDGYLLVPELIPGILAREAEAAMWESLGADARLPRTWTLLGPRPHVLREKRLTATYTDRFLAAAAQLAGEDVAGFGRPTHAFTINNLPVSRDWQPQAPHLDCTIPELRLRAFPPPYRIGALTYLTDVQRHGGGTIVWPGSHVKLAALVRSDPRKYKYLAAVSTDLGRVDLGTPMELTPCRGEVLFHHPLLVHASSDNVGKAPRLAISHKW